MENIFNKLTSLSTFYKTLYKLTFLLSGLRKLYIFILSLFLFFSAFFEISLLAFLYVLIKAFMDPTYYSGNYFFDFFINFLNVESNNELVLYFSFFFYLNLYCFRFF